MTSSLRFLYQNFASISLPLCAECPIHVIVLDLLIMKLLSTLVLELSYVLYHSVFQPRSTYTTEMAE